MTFLIYTTERNNNPELDLVLKFFDVYGYRVKFVYEIDTMMRLSRGHVNPGHGYVVLVNDVSCTNFFQVVHAFEEMGLVPC